MSWLPRPSRERQSPDWPGGIADDDDGIRTRRNAWLPATAYATRANAARGLYRIFNAPGFRFYRSNSAPPAEGDVPFATNATLPYQPTNTYADGTWYLSVSYFNGVLDSGFLPIGPHGETYLVMELSGGAAVGTRPTGPTGATLVNLAGGVVQLQAYYVSLPDGASAADEWAIAYTTDGSTPASGAPSLTVAMSAGPFQILSYSLPAQSAGTTVKVQLQTYNGTLYSLPGAVLTIVTPAAPPTSPLDVKSWPGALPQQ